MDFEQFKNSLEVRTAVLKDSLLAEKLISEVCCYMLGIAEQEKSYCFGNTSKSLSFNHKIYLLMDIEALESDERNKFLKFMEIRNQFMHNIGCNSFVDCMDMIDGLEKYLTKCYGALITEDDRELRLFECYKFLVKEIQNYIMAMLDLAKKRLGLD